MGKSKEERKSASKKKADGSKRKSGGVDKTGNHPKPTRVQTAYTFFNVEKSKEFRANGSGKETFALVGEAWGKATEGDKAPYVKMQAEDQKRYDRQVEELKKKGYYTLANG